MRGHVVLSLKQLAGNSYKVPENVLCPAIIVSPATITTSLSTITTSLSMQVKVQVIHWTTWDSDTGNTEHIQTHL